MAHQWLLNRLIAGTFLLSATVMTRTTTEAFHTSSATVTNQPTRTRTRTKTTSLNLIPLTKFKDELSFFTTCSDEHRCSCIDRDGIFTPISSSSLTTKTTAEQEEEPFRICLVEESDLPEVSLFIVKAFGADAINLSSNEFSSFEKRIMEPAMDFFNGYAAVTAFAEVLWGLRIRQSDRIPLSKLPLRGQKQRDNDNNSNEKKKININDISGPDLTGLESTKDKIEASNRKSLILVVGRPAASNSDKSDGDGDGDVNRCSSSKWESIESNIDVVASVELRLQPCDAKIPFSLPWWDALERRIAKFFGIPRDDSSKHLQPYLSTLCVAETYRGQRIGRAMVRCLEDIATTKWGYSKMYLHVDSDNTAALNLYKSEGYVDVGRRWNPFWAGGAADIGYFVKDLKQ